jgi:hypothetical protein
MDTQLLDCWFEDNVSDNVAGVKLRDVVAAIVRRCAFVGNVGTYGGAITSGGSATIENCRFENNGVTSAATGVGAIGCSAGTVVRNCVFIRNDGRAAGGGAIDAAGAVIEGCAFSENMRYLAGDGDDIYSRGATVVANCVFWDSSTRPPIAYRDLAPAITFSIVRGGWPGEGNSDTDPRFVDQANGDLHLLPDSPAINAGDPAYAMIPGESDIDSQRRVWGGRVDMGADEYGSFVYGDLNCDGALDAFDIEPFILAIVDPQQYAVRYPECEATLGDLNGDGVVDAFDISPFIDALTE